MDITTLTVVLSAVVVVAAAFLIASNEPPLWLYALGCAGSWPLSHVLLDGPGRTAGLGDGSVGAWAVRLAVTTTVTALLSFIVDKDRRAGDTV
ncbi:hypothetical protein ACFW9L_42720 [Streptomyces sp. NPDC059517]|uniref:hypothetical protein n=1 Tax=Streptomyces sp. NPDC059517 TaxID=3346855 RepID=UPI0036ADF7EE